MSKRVARVLTAVVEASTAWMRPYRRAITRCLIAERLAQTHEVATPGGPIRFHAPSARALHDPANLYGGEPETVAWLDGLAPGEILWDIGANIGLYALYAARARGLRVLAFEPSAASYAALTRNIEINGLGEAVSAYCLAFDEAARLDHLHMAHTEAGHSMHAFARTETVEGPIDVAFRQAVPGFSVDGFMALFAPPPPRHVKLDVDGAEEAILRGARATLAACVESVLVEIDGPARAARGKAMRDLLAGLGFREDTSFAATARRNVVFRKA